MTLTTTQSITLIILIVLGTQITRFLPFICFPERKQSPFGIPEIIAVLCVVAIHLWKSNTLLSIGIGTIVYIFLVQVVF